MFCIFLFAVCGFVAIVVVWKEIKSTKDCPKPPSQLENCDIPIGSLPQEALTPEIMVASLVGAFFWLACTFDEDHKIVGTRDVGKFGVYIFIGKAINHATGEYGYFFWDFSCKKDTPREECLTKEQVQELSGMCKCCGRSHMWTCDTHFI